MVYSQYRIIFSTFLMFIIMPLEKMVNSQSKACTPTKVGKLLVANCSDLNLTQIPTDLNSNIQVLDITNNPLTKIKQSSLKNYTSLINFMYRMNPKSLHHCEIDGNAFENLLSLKSLDLGMNELGPKVKLRFPPNVWNLKLDHTRLTTDSLEVSYLQKLRRLIVPDNDLTEFPALHATAPVRLIDVRNNPIPAIPVRPLAKYCKLEYFCFIIDSKWPMFLIKNCSFTQLRLWFISHKINGSNISEFFDESENTCDLIKEFKEMEADYAECLNRKRNGDENDPDEDDYPDVPVENNSSYLMYVIVFAALIATTVIVCVGGVLYKRRKNRSRNDEDATESEQYNEGEDEEYEE